MKALALATGLFLSAPALAQQSSTPPNPEVLAYRDLLTEANSRVAGLSAQVSALTKELQDSRVAKTRPVTNVPSMPPAPSIPGPPAQP